MKEFWSEYKKNIWKLLLNQFGAAFLGIMLIMAAWAVRSQKDWLGVVASCLATAFYLYLIYNLLWERGGQDRIRIDGGRMERKPMSGFWVILIANIPNIILGILVVVSNPFRDSMEWATKMNVIARGILLVWHSMYAGFISAFSPNNPIVHLLDVLPALFVGTGGYLLGLSNRRLMSWFSPKQQKKDK